METTYPVYWPQFYTATIYQWKQLLLKEAYKNIIIESLQYLVSDKRIVLNGFVIMSNHLHLIWQASNVFTPSEVQASFMKYTSRQLIRLIKVDSPDMLTEFKVNRGDRDHQIWKRDPLGFELFTHEVFIQKLDYMHYNPVRASLCNYPEEYYYSSAKFYEEGIDDFGMLTHFAG
ncbi:MAG: transposase [Ferruginibacter sp.]|nr:transposase [Ferruginibacter sp.]